MGERVTSRLEEVRMLDAEHVMATYARQPAAFVRGEGATLYDADGEAYLDFLSGISVSSSMVEYLVSRRSGISRM